jgi:hypothetical protein
MTDRAGFFASCADILTAMSVYYVVAGVLIMSQRGWGLHLFWILLLAALCAAIYALVLKKPRSVSFLTVLTGGLFVLVMAAYILASTTRPAFGYVFMLAIGGGMTVGLPLYYGLNRPQIHQHLTHLDVLLLALLGLLLCREALGINSSTVGLMVIVLLMDAASAVGLRMTEGGSDDGRDAFKAMMVALVAAVVVLAVILLLTAVFSESGSATGGVLHGVGAFLSSIGSGIEKFFRRIAELFAAEEQYAPVTLDGELPSTAALSGAEGRMELSVNTTVLGIGLCVAVVAAAVAIVVIMGRKKVVRETEASASTSDTVVHRSGGTMGALWDMLKKAVRFRWSAFVMRNTPRGLLVILERRGRRRHTPRQTGESMGHFVRRMDASGGLDTLADALDREFYGGGGQVLSSRECRALRSYMRKAVQPW